MSTPLEPDVGSRGPDPRRQLNSVTEEMEFVRAAIRLMRVDFGLTEEPGKGVDNYEELKRRLDALTYEGVRAVQQ